MDIARMLNVTILACLLILTGCLGFNDDDVIDDAQGDDGDDGHDDSGSTTIMNAYPPVQSIMGNETITVAAGEYVEILKMWQEYAGASELYDTSVLGAATFDYNCGTFSGTVWIAGGGFLPNDGTGCSYSDNTTYAPALQIIYRVW